MKIKRHKSSALLFLIIFLLVPFSAIAQDVEKFETYSKLLSPEKLYLHIDRDSYAAGDTIWFKAYLKNSSDICEFHESNFIYVEFIAYRWGKDVFSGKDEETPSIVKRIKIKRTNEVLQGYIDIPEDINTGKAILRAYTYWGLNFDPEYVFSRNVQIVNPFKDAYVEKLIEDNVRERSTYLTAGVKYPFDSKRAPKQDIDCQFFAESGRLLSGVEGTVAFKALAENGFGEKVKGYIKDQKGEKYAEFESDEYGFGKFKIRATSGQKLTAVVTDERGVEKSVKFIESEKSGVAIYLNWEGDHIVASTISTPDINADALNFILFDGTDIFYTTPLSNAKKIAILIANLPVGTVNAAITDVNSNVLATRTFFVIPEAKQVKLTQDKPSYSPRSKVDLNILLSDENGKPLSGNFSIAITDSKLSPYLGRENNILSYMLLQSELKGYIEEPQRFFDPEIPIAKRENDVDLLMLTQGWRYYDIESILKGENQMPVFGREYIQTISGRVKSRKNRSSTVSFVAPSIGFSAIGQLDSSGAFELRDLSFPDSTLFIVNAVGSWGGRSFIPYIDEDNFAPLIRYFRADKPEDPSVAGISQAQKDRLSESEDIPLYFINPIFIRANKRYAVNDPTPMGMKKLYRPDQLREGEQLEPYKDMDLTTYIYQTCQGLRMDYDSITGEKILLCRIPPVASQFQITTGWVEIAVFINGVQMQSSADLSQFTVRDISSLLYLRGSEAAPYVAMNESSASIRSAIFIKTALNTRTGMPRNMAKGYPLGWQRPKYFYSPAYDVSSGSKYNKDLRSTIYWNPELKLTESGATETFYTSDSKSDYTVVLEGIADNGDYIFSKQTININN